MAKKPKRITLVAVKLFEEGFIGTLSVKDWALVTGADKRTVWRKWRPFIGRRVRVVAEVF